MNINIHIDINMNIDIIIINMNNNLGVGDHFQVLKESEGTCTVLRKYNIFEVVHLVMGHNTIVSLPLTKASKCPGLGKECDGACTLVYKFCSSPAGLWQ